MMDQNPLFLSDHENMYGINTDHNRIMMDDNHHSDDGDEEDDDDDEIYDDSTDDEDNDDDEYYFMQQWVSSFSMEHSSRLRHIRCLYRCMTFPIVPCIFVTILSYLYFLFTAFLLDNNNNSTSSSIFPNNIWWKWYHNPKDNNDGMSMNDPTLLPLSSSSSNTPCAQPLHVYAYISIIIVFYMYFHRTLRTMILTRTFHLPSSRTLPTEQQQQRNDSSNHTTEVRHPPNVEQQQQPSPYIVPFVQQRYDQIVYSLIIVYICVGLSFVQSCRTTGGSSGSSTATMMSTNIVEPSYSPDDDPNWNDVSSSLSSMSACQETCPYIFQALTIYISMIELTILAYIIPMLCLPCIYFYLLRHGNDSTSSSNNNNNNNRNDPGHISHTHRDYNPSFMMDPETFLRILNGRTNSSTNQGVTQSQPPRTTFDRFTNMTHPFLFGSYYHHYTYNTNTNRMDTTPHDDDGTNRYTTTNNRRSRRNRKLRVQDIVSQFEIVHLSKRRKVDSKHWNDDTTTLSVNSPNDDVDDVEIIVSLDKGGTTASKKEKMTSTSSSSCTIEVLDSSSLECCICMNEFIIVDDAENGRQYPFHVDDESTKIVRTPICHHLFHQHCIQNWIVGSQWWDGRNIIVDSSDTNNMDDNTSATVTSHLLPQQPPPPPRRTNRIPPMLAYRTTCPLCRTHLYRPSLLQQQQERQNYGSTV